MPVETTSAHRRAAKSTILSCANEELAANRQRGSRCRTWGRSRRWWRASRRSLKSGSCACWRRCWCASAYPCTSCSSGSPRTNREGPAACGRRDVRCFPCV
ncbi:hypothetical protein JKP88DRAFT_348306 [Tribonema minus]|uniref:Uncharacterized protein n=1 Tax=Tribonema minus TaxID=303371 RepID=A0A835Z140_9STRA|nr:hypothetical protein JKP88DRAFT_348306 [Tribonema minus]